MTCHVSVEFAAVGEPGPHSASLVVDHDAPGGSRTFGLAVEVESVDSTPPTSVPSTQSPATETKQPPTTATPPSTDGAPASTPDPVLDVSDASCDEEVYIGDSPASCVVEVSAIGPTPVTIQSSVVDPADAGDAGRWVVEQACVGVLERGAICVIDVRFTAGPPADFHTATLVITHNASPGTTSVDLKVFVFQQVE